MLACMAIALLLLDVDGVLLRHERSRRLAWLAAALERPGAAIDAALQAHGLEEAWTLGRIDTTTYLQQLGDALHCRVDETHWIGSRIASSAAQEAVVERLLTLPAGIALGVLSNNGPLIASVLEKQLPTLWPRLRGRVQCSATLGRRKPDPEAFLAAVQALQSTPAQTLLIDDLFANVRSARAIGFHAETVQDGGGLRRALRRHGVV